MSWAEILLGLLTGSVFLTAIIGGCLVIHGTIKKTKWGINFAGVKCPQCGDKLHPPYGLTWYGGWTKETLWAICKCLKCGIITDNWGRQIGKVKQEQ